MPSIDAGTPPGSGNGLPPEAARRKDMRDALWGRALILGVLLLLTLAVTRTCGSRDEQITQERAVALATEAASFTPCQQEGCMVVRALNQGIPTRLVWIVGLADRLDADGEPVRFENFEIDAETGEVTRRS